MKTAPFERFRLRINRTGVWVCFHSLSVQLETNFKFKFRVDSDHGRVGKSNSNTNRNFFVSINWNCKNWNLFWKINISEIYWKGKELRMKCWFFLRDWKRLVSIVSFSWIFVLPSAQSGITKSAQIGFYAMKRTVWHGHSRKYKSITKLNPLRRRLAGTVFFFLCFFVLFWSRSKLV